MYDLQFTTCLPAGKVYDFNKLKLFSFFFLIFSFFSFTSCSPKQEIIEASFPDGSPKIIGIYSGKNKTGEIKYYENGQKEIKGYYNEKLERHGRWTAWYENGKIWSECEYKNGLKEGKSAVYYENGQKRYEGNYKNDSTIGLWKFWNENGTLVKEMNYPSN